MIHTLAKPRIFFKFGDFLLPLLFIALMILAPWGLYEALVLSPVDYQQGEAVRIMYVHVPASWMALGAYTGLAISSLFYLVWRHPLADILAEAIAPLGTVFTALSLITGAIWGKPMWGTWWVWDARLTSVLVLFFIYLGYLFLRASIEDPYLKGRISAFLALFGMINLPIIKFSVEWWNTLHQPASVFRAQGSAIHPGMMAPLMLMATVYVLVFVIALFWRAKALWKNRKMAAQNAI
ncbi:Cytochrome c maturation protein C [Candidatus Bealeia paramacronuclearis]|uniref:Heme exporter protein C n=1 Tax=Candidatus Bealeia paramacronuclearis TaxID=1921001 RepID=A0ABZ2C1R4_9PROT|nr:Cytochrome c maturation protein C [Candidatus Bealeia paramacronuclearis]